MRPYGGFGVEDELLAGFFADPFEVFPGAELDAGDEPGETDEAAGLGDADAEDVLCAWE